MSEQSYYEKNKDRCLAIQRAYYHRNREKRKAYQRSWISRNRVKQNSYNEKWVAANKHSRRAIERKAHFGIDPSEQTSMMEVQLRRCALCGKKLMEDRNTHLDHDHKTGKVRGFLCHRCNYGMSFVDDLTWLASAMKYAGIQISTSEKEV